MNYPQKRQTNVAVAEKRLHDLDHYHIGTTDFGIMKPIECRYMVPGDEFNINVINETRVLNPMPSPTIGQFDVVYRQFFVPINCIWDTFYDFLKGQQAMIDGVFQNVPQAPYVNLFDLINYVINIDHGLVKVVGTSTEGTYDFSISQTSPSVSTIYYAWTKEGRKMVNFLTSLGINIPWGCDISTQSNNIKLYIVLPLAAFWKFYFDWIVPSRFIRDHEDNIQILLSSDLFRSGHVISAANFFRFLVKEPLAYYLDDVFTSSTEFPFQSSEPSDSIQISNPNGDAFPVVNVTGSPDLTDNGATSISTGQPGGISLFNMYTLQTLGKLQDMLNRNLLAGTKVQDWLLTEFGMRPNDDALHLSTYLGAQRTTLSVDDVISNADTLSADGESGVALGSYAGYIRNNQRMEFGYKAQEHGFYFITHEIVPKTSYFQGLQAQFDLGDRFDFFQPEFDNQQGAPIPFRRLYFSQNKSTELQRYDANFGFNLQYADLKIATDVVSGDFRTRFGRDLKSWFLARDMSYISDINNAINGIDEEFCLVKSKYQDWHYIFNFMDDELDPFLVAFKFKNSAQRPMKSITEGFEPVYKNSNKSVNLDFSGSVK